MGGFKLGSAIAMNGGVINGGMNGSGGVLNGVGNGGMPVAVGQGSLQMNGKFSGAFESSIDGFVKSGAMSTPTTPLPEFVPMGTVNGMRGVNGMNGPTKTSPPNHLHAPISEVEDEISDVFTTLSVKDPMIAAPGYGRGRSRRSSAPVNMSVQHLWGSMGDQGGEISNGGHTVGVGDTGVGGGGGGSVVGGGIGNLVGGSRNFGSSTIASFNGWSTCTPAPVPVTATLNQVPATVSSIWSGGFQPTVTSQSSRPNSQTSSYSNSSEQGSSSLSTFSPIYSPTSNTTNGFFSHEPVSSASSLLTSNPLSSSVSVSEHQNPPAFKV